MVCPRFAPVNAADSHRARLLLPYLEANGWQAEVLAADPGDVPGPHDPWLEDRLPSAVPVHRVRAGRISGWGLNGLAQRSFWSLYRKGNELLATGRFDLVFFSTTEFLLHVLGPLWQRRWRVPFCMDYQDPWVNDYYQQNPEIVPPGGRIKYALVSRVHARVEEFVAPRCSGFLAVSPAYIPQLECRYGPAVSHQPRLVAGFPAEPSELDGMNEPQAAVGKAGPAVWRYVGRGGADMSLAAKAFFLAWRSAIDRGDLLPDAVRFEAIGTSYAAAGRGAKTLQPLAEHAGLQASVSETTERLGYSGMLLSLRGSDALVVFGSNDPAYTASKIYPYLLSGKPLLAIFHEQSTVVPLLQAAGGGVLVTFNERTTVDELAVAIENAWFRTGGCNRLVPLDRKAFEPFTAVSQARAVTEWFNRVVAHAA